MPPFKADLHCHSIFSDGTFSPEEILELAHQLGLQGLSITDHDTVNAYERALISAKDKNIQLISGVEFSTTHRGSSVHLLGYAFDVNAPSIKDLCLKHIERRTRRIEKILHLLKTHGMPLQKEDFSKESLLPNHPIGRPHIAQAMVKKGYISSVQEAFHSYLGDQRLCFVPGESFSVEETIEAIHSAKGFAVIAHPHLIKNEQVALDLLNMPFDGIEGYYARFFSHQEKRWIKIGERKGWIVTGGSDFHGTIKPNNPLGCSWVNEETFKILKTRCDQNNPTFL